MSYKSDDDCNFIEYCGECPYANNDEHCLRRPSFYRQLKLSRLPLYQWRNYTLYPDDIDVEAFEKLGEIADNIKEIVETPGHKNLIICSETMGNGKTAWAIKILKRYLYDIAWSVFLDDETAHGAFVLTSQYVCDAKAFDVNDVCHKRFMELRDVADKADIAVWDDIGSAEYTRYDYTNLLVPIERRNLAGKFNIFTTNFTDCTDKFIERVGDRLATRIWQTSDIIELKGRGFRGTKLC